MASPRAVAVAAARAYGLPVPIFLQQISQESGFNPRARSGAGAQGIAQFMPATARSMGVNPWNVRSALYGAAKLDARNLAKYHNWRDVLSLYNSGRGWEQGQRIAQTRNYVTGILARAGSGAVSSSSTVPAPPMSAQAPAAPNDSARKAIALALIQASQQTTHGNTPNYGGLLQALTLAKQQQQTREVQPLTRGTMAPALPPAIAGKRGGISELFYDPLGAIKNGQRIAPIGGHNDHVHFATMDPRKMVAAITEARRMGMHVSENDFVGVVHPVHVHDSNHYKVIGAYRGRKISGAVDVGGTPSQMAAYYRWVARNL